MLTPKQLLAETAKFFALHPDRWVKGYLVCHGKNPANASDSDCFCAVGYMAYRLAKEGVHIPTAGSAYEVVGDFFEGSFGRKAEDLYEINDNNNNPVDVVTKLKQVINDYYD